MDQRAQTPPPARLRRRSRRWWWIALRPLPSRASPLRNDVIQPRAVSLSRQLETPGFRVASKVEGPLEFIRYKEITDSTKRNLSRRIAPDIGIRLENASPVFAVGFDPSPEGLVPEFHFPLQIVIVRGFDAGLIHCLRPSEINLNIVPGSSSLPGPPSRGGRVVEGELHVPRIRPRAQTPLGPTGQFLAAIEETQLMDAPLLYRTGCATLFDTDPADCVFRELDLLQHPGLVGGIPSCVEHILEVVVERGIIVAQHLARCVSVRDAGQVEHSLAFGHMFFHQASQIVR